MITLSYLLASLKPYALNDIDATDAFSCPEQIELLEDQDMLRADRTYLGTAQSAALLAEVPAELGCVVLLAGDGKDPTPGTCPQECVVLAFTCSFTQLINAFSRASAASHEYRRAFQGLMERHKDIHAVVELAGSLAGAPAFLFDYGNRLVATDGVGTDDYFSNLIAKTGELPASVQKSLFHADPTQTHGALHLADRDLTLFAQRFFYRGKPACTIVLEASSQNAPVDYFALCAYAMDCVRNHLVSSGFSPFETKDQSFRRCWSTIMEGKLVGSEDIREALSHMPSPVNAFIHTGVVIFPAHEDIPYYYVLARLREIFPSTNMTVYEGDIALLFSYEERSFIAMSS